MPEGPEIRIAADRIARVLEGQRVDDVELTFLGLGTFVLSYWAQPSRV